MVLRMSPGIALPARTSSWDGAAGRRRRRAVQAGQPDRAEVEPAPETRPTTSGEPASSAVWSPRLSTPVPWSRRDHAGDLVGMAGGEGERVEAAERMSGEDVGPGTWRESGTCAGRWRSARRPGGVRLGRSSRGRHGRTRIPACHGRPRGLSSRGSTTSRRRRSRARRWAAGAGAGGAADVRPRRPAAPAGCVGVIGLFPPSRSRRPPPRGPSTATTGYSSHRPPGYTADADATTHPARAPTSAGGHTQFSTLGPGPNTIRARPLKSMNGREPRPSAAADR